MSINQSHYIDDLVKKFLGPRVTPVKTSTTDDFKLLVPSESKKPLEKPYFAQCSRPDVSFAVNRFSQFLENLSLKHWEASL